MSVARHPILGKNGFGPSRESRGRAWSPARESRQRVARGLVGEAGLVEHLRRSCPR